MPNSKLFTYLSSQEVDLMDTRIDQKEETDQIQKLKPAFVSKHMCEAIRKRGLMVSNKDQALDSIKTFMAKQYLKFIDKIAYVSQNIANRVIVTTNIVETAYNML